MYKSVAQRQQQAQLDNTQPYFLLRRDSCPPSPSAGHGADFERFPCNALVAVVPQQQIAKIKLTQAALSARPPSCHLAPVNRRSVSGDCGHTTLPSPSYKTPSVVDSSAIFGAGTIPKPGKREPAFGRRFPPRMLRLNNTGNSESRQQGHPLVESLQPCSRRTHLFPAMRMLAGIGKKRALSQQLDEKALTPN